MVTFRAVERPDHHKCIYNRTLYVKRTTAASCTPYPLERKRGAMGHPIGQRAHCPDASRTRVHCDGRLSATARSYAAKRSAPAYGSPPYVAPRRMTSRRVGFDRFCTQRSGVQKRQRNEPCSFVFTNEQRSGREDLNLRLLGPEPSALPDCATPRVEAPCLMTGSRPKVNGISLLRCRSLSGTRREPPRLAALPVHAARRFAPVAPCLCPWLGASAGRYGWRQEPRQYRSQKKLAENVVSAMKPSQPPRAPSPMTLPST